MYINEPVDNSPLPVSAPMKAVVYASLAGTLILGIYPQPVIDWVVSASIMFSKILAPTASLGPSVLPPFGG
jgi:NADH-quinone oxidoreductase subunit N